MDLSSYPKNDKGLPVIPRADYYKMSNDFRGTFSDLFGDHPELKGKRTMLNYDPERGTCLIFEGNHFVIE